MTNNSLRYAPDTSNISNSMTVGYSDGKYSSISMVKHGNGMVCIVAGDYSNNQRSDLAQIIGANLCYRSQLIDSGAGDVTRGSVNGILAYSMNNLSAYTYLGGYYVVYARCDCYVGMIKI